MIPNFNSILSASEIVLVKENKCKKDKGRTKANQNLLAKVKYKKHQVEAKESGERNELFTSNYLQEFDISIRMTDKN